MFRKTKDDQNNCLIHYLAMKCCTKMIKDEKYVKKSDSNIPGMDDMIPIHFTARYGTECKDIKGTLKIMMNFTDEMNATLQKDKTGYTVLDHAMQSGRVDIVKTIIEISDCWNCH